MSSIAPVKLRCAHKNAPLGLEDGQASFSWQVQALTRNAAQSAWQIQVAPQGQAFDEDCVWDTGKTSGGDQLHIHYSGEPLAAHGRYQWRVQLWDAEDAASGWSEPASFAMGILDCEEWKRAQWISHFQSSLSACPHLRKEFAIKGEIADARLYLTARGLADIEINGQPITDCKLLPGWTDYSVRQPSHCFDVTALLKSGDNAIGAILAEGWYRGKMTWESLHGIWGGVIQLLAMLRIERPDGSVEWVVTDDSWKSAAGPTLSASLLDGESYDANLTLGDWSQPGYESTKRWYDVKAQPVGDELIERHVGVPVRELKEFKPVNRWQPCPGKWIFDLGQNFSGYARLKLNVPAGTTLRLRFAEVLTPDKEIYVDNLRTALATDLYVASGEADETWAPKFSFHGFQYVELSGFPGEPPEDVLTGIFVGSDCPEAGQLRCSNPMLEKLASNAVWTQRSNYLEVPTDCPQRDERLGWTGDAQAYLRTAIAFHDVSAFFDKWLVDLEDACEPDGRAPMVAPTGSRGRDKKLINSPNRGTAEAAWGDATTICPMTIYKCYGDRRVLERHYGMMTRYVDFYRRTTVPGRKVRYGYQYDNLPEGKGVISPTLFGDWLNVEAKTAGEIIRTAFYAESTRLCCNAAYILSKTEDAEKFSEEWDAIRTDFQREFLTEDGRIVGRSIESDSQTGYLLALHFDLLDEAHRAKAVEHLVADIRSRDTHLSTGFVGLPYLLPVLSRFGQTELCYELLLKEDYPSWGYEIAHGATSIWERWNGYHDEDGPGDPNMNSYAHYAYGAVCEWLFSDMAGIELLDVAFGKIRIRPRVGGGLTYAGATHECVRGSIRSDWKIEGDTFQLEVEIPGNASAEIHLPTADAASITEDDAEVPSTESDASGYRVVEVGAGNYKFRCKLP
ncbi:family 78 glycoside hydrolase catalytic domain [Cerasicoccus fimbriatus]|uniref:family 78 glycoside hydrolase catalytic domain n=1 Tax=Cerasicoccus fimbriatus TaxID=3014554 RepID=UPI0022B34F53|nr:family 78 glycoside hydrolase catalytic domain [Cerasicoccus sp. TK19100]